jgi:DNA repair protein RadD
MVAESRADILGRFERGDFTLLSNVSLLSEGFDVPDTSCMILARPTKSLTRFLQMVGRVLRPAPGKTRALLLDHSGSVERIGHPFDDLPLELDDGTANRSGKSKQERKKSEPKPCPKCKFVRDAGVHECPKCGFAPTRQSDVEVAEGELVKLDRKGKKPATPDRKQHVYSQLLQVCRARGYRPGWAANQYRAMFGVWPRGLREVEAAPTGELLSWLKSQHIRFAKGSQKAEVGHA